MIVYTHADNGSVEVDSASTLILAANDRRRFARITNGSDTGIWVSYGEAAVVGQGDYLGSGGGVLEIDSDNMWRGEIYGITTSGDDKIVGTVEFK